jgi:hypothetical protein
MCAEYELGRSNCQRVLDCAATIFNIITDPSEEPDFVGYDALCFGR